MATRTHVLIGVSLWAASAVLLATGQDVLAFVAFLVGLPSLLIVLDRTTGHAGGPNSSSGGWGFGGGDDFGGGGDGGGGGGDGGGGGG